MKINLEYYSGEDKYSDDNIENDIIKYIEINNNLNYESIFDTDIRWPVYYHLSSIRQNILSWYPFNKESTILEIGAGMGAITEILVKKSKRVVSVELSKKRATAIQKRCSNAKNLEIIVGNFNDIKFNEKFDYITLIGVLEYAPSFSNSDNPMYDFLNKIKKLLKPNGKILIAIENRMGLKYLCGAPEDHTNILYSGIYNYENINNVRTLDKNEFIKLFEMLKLKYNFYYSFPDYKFPEIILTDQFVSNKYDLKYNPYYSLESYMNIDEMAMVNNLNNLGILDKFSNSFFIELSQKNEINKIEFIKFNNVYRNNNYQIGTIVKKHEVIKYPLSEYTIPFLNNIYENHLNLKQINKNYIGRLDKKNNEIVFEKIKFSKLIDIIFLNEKTFEKYFSKLINTILNSSKKEYQKNNIFSNFNIDISEKKLKKMTFLKKGYLDLTFFNSFVDNNDELIFIDQEWCYDYVPFEYILYRNIKYIPICDKNIDIEKLYKKYNIDVEIFEKLESAFVSSISKTYLNVFFKNYELIDAKKLSIDYKNLRNNYEHINKELNKEKAKYKNIKIEYDSILESKIILDSEKANILQKYAELETTNELLNQDVYLLRNEKNKISEQLNKTDKVLNDIYNSKTWKLIVKIKKVLNVIRSK